MYLSYVSRGTKTYVPLLAFKLLYNNYTILSIIFLLFMDISELSSILFLYPLIYN